MALSTGALALLARNMERFEAGASRERTGTGSRREGEQFEALVAEFWGALVNHLLLEADTGKVITTKAKVAGRPRTWTRLEHGPRAITLPDAGAASRNLSACDEPRRWLDLSYSVSEMVNAYPGETEAIERYSPPAGKFRRERYPQMFEGLTTKFDDVILLETDGVLTEKLLLEYKTAKSTKGRQIDGNAHERLSFQIMQYLEVATRYTRCSLHVLSNGAFVRYRNKYHVNFHVQADRLSNFAWFDMRHASTADEYESFVAALVHWFRHGGRLWD
ncbi:MAG: hypothetical protein V3V08_10145 [Nannocystaceae bacterium]